MSTFFHSMLAVSVLAFALVGQGCQSAPKKDPVQAPLPAPPEAEVFNAVDTGESADQCCAKWIGAGQCAHELIPGCSGNPALGARPPATVTESEISQ